MLKIRTSHGVMVFLAFVLLLFSVQFLCYVVSHVREAESNAHVHLVVRESDPKGFTRWRETLEVENWTFQTLGVWSTLHESDWQGLMDTAVSPADLYQDRAAGVWVAKLSAPTWMSVFRGHPELTWDRLSAHGNIVSVMGYPRWATELRTWFLTWAVISVLMILTASALLVSAVMADVSLGMVDHRDELEVRYWLGATRPQLRYPLVRQLLQRSTGFILMAICFNIVCYLYLVHRQIVVMNLEWVQLFSIVSGVILALGMVLVWLASRRGFHRIIARWAP